MTARLLDGNALSQKLRAEFIPRVKRLVACGIRPGLAVILVGDDPASMLYVRNKVSACEQSGIYSEKHIFPANVSLQLLGEHIARMNADPAIHGILVQLPLPKSVNTDFLLSSISPDKDVDGFQAANLGALYQGKACFIPCTPYGIMKFFEWENIGIESKEAVVVGRSSIVGKPTGALLMNEGATLTICHSKTPDLASHCRRADILVVAVGKPALITADMVKPGAVVVDVGINRLPNGKLCGDVDFPHVREIASYITPVPGGVGPMTITMLIENTLESAERALARKLTPWVIKGENA